MEFKPFEKIPRWSRGIVVTEKIDGTNAVVAICALPDDEVMPTETPLVAVRGKLLIYAGSRSRWVTPASDNFGFAAWVQENADELAKLGEGYHYGEWWGAGIQRRYGLDTKRLSLFNVERWGEHNPSTPACCDTVPILYRGGMTPAAIAGAVEQLRADGSVAAPGFKRPEGVVIYHYASRSLYKITLEGDEGPKGARV